jgi:hypothetical protein
MKLASNGTTDGPGGGWFKIQEQGLDVASMLLRFSCRIKLGTLNWLN